MEQARSYSQDEIHPFGGGHLPETPTSISQMRRLLPVLMFCMLVPTKVSATEIVDYGTMRNNIRSCPVNMFVTGVDLDGNRLLCDNSFGPYIPSATFEIVDRTNMAGTRKSCATGFGVTGVSPVRNAVSCAHRGLMDSFVHNTTTRLGMRACPSGTVVVAVGLEDNTLRCGRREDFCFGGLGERCGITKEGLNTPYALCSNGVCWINTGSWIHDQCCWQFPNGYACRAGPTAAHDGHCVTEFSKAVNHLAIGYRWTRNVDFNQPNRTGTVVFAQYCAVNGTIVHRLDVTAHCCGRRGRPFDPLRDLTAAARQSLSPVEIRNGNARVCQ